MSNWKRNNIEAENIARYHRGEISRKQFLEQSRSGLVLELAEQQSILSTAQSKSEAVSAQIAAIDEELLALA